LIEPLGDLVAQPRQGFRGGIAPCLGPGPALAGFADLPVGLSRRLRSQAQPVSPAVSAARPPLRSPAASVPVRIRASVSMAIGRRPFRQFGDLLHQRTLPLGEGESLSRGAVTAPPPRHLVDLDRDEPLSPCLCLARQAIEQPA